MSADSFTPPPYEDHALALDSSQSESADASSAAAVSDVEVDLKGAGTILADDRSYSSDADSGVSGGRGPSSGAQVVTTGMSPSEGQWTLLAILTMFGICAFALYGGIEVIVALAAGGFVACCFICFCVILFVWGPAGTGGYGVVQGNQERGTSPLICVSLFCRVQ
jgi:hypothetical protein